MMSILFAFLIGGLICLIGQLLVDLLKLQPVHVTVSFVFVGALLELFGLYDNIIKLAGAGALLPISSFGHTMTHSAVELAVKGSYLDLFGGVFQQTSSGIAYAIVIAFICSLIFKPKG